MSAFLDLRSWLTHLDQQDRLAILKPGRQLEFEVAGIANRWDGRKATVFPKLGNCDGVIVSGLLSQRHWMAEALGTTESKLLSRFLLLLFVQQYCC